MAKEKSSRSAKPPAEARSAASDPAPAAPSRPDTAQDRAVAEALKAAKLLTQRQLDRAVREVKQAGGSLGELLKAEIGDDKLRRALDKEVPFGGVRQKLGGILVGAGWFTPDDLQRLAAPPSDESDRVLGNMLVREGVISQRQLEQAQQVQTTTGHTLWRALLNMGVVAPKAIGDVMRGEASMPLAAAAEERLGRLMVDKGMVTESEMAAALQAKRGTDKSIADVLLEKGLVNEIQIALALAEQHKIPFVDLTKTRIDTAAVGLLPRVTIIESQALPIRHEGKTLTVALADPARAGRLDSSAIVLGVTISPMVAPKSQVAAAIKQYVGEVVIQSGAGPAAGAAGTQVVAVGDEMEELAKTASPAALVDRLIEEAVKARATDVHFDPEDSGLRVRYRIDSLLHDVMSLPESLGTPVISRLKILANMNIIERRAPQDGHISRPLGDKTQEIRVASVPTGIGEKLVLRLMDEAQVLTGLNQLGLEPEQIDVLTDLIEKPYGMLLTVGPVGSGKTTTLYACLNQVNVLTKNVMTIEDPVEYKIRGVNQLQVNYATDFTFAKGLRAILRQDPDCIMVGEIRDDETAQIAIRAAMTGVLVFSTMHANDAPSTVGSLYNHNIPGFLISSALIGVVAQRLVRKTCPDCKVQYEPDSSLFKQLGISDDEAQQVDGKLWRGVGCAKCFHTGYLGRTGVFEIMEMSEEIRDLIFRQTTKEVIRTVAIDLGMQTLKESTKNKVLDGITTAEEMFRVIYV
jgi:type IV pilus assembly protein PilB